jgi:hypothetical protein
VSEKTFGRLTSVLTLLIFLTFTLGFWRGCAEMP